MKQPGPSQRTLVNRANAARSTGPKTPAGKHTSSHNALKTGLTGQTVLLPTDDLVAYQAHLARVEARYLPATDEERMLTQSIAQIEWRLWRIPTLESGLWALGRKQFAERMRTNLLPIAPSLLRRKLCSLMESSWPIWLSRKTA